MVGFQITLFKRGNLAFGLAQIEKQLFLAGSRAHFDQRPRAQDIFLDRGANPPHRIGSQTEAFIRLEPFDRLHQADIAFRNHFADRQAVAAIAHGDFGNQPQMRGHQLFGRVAVAMLAPLLGQHEFLLRPQHRKPPDLVEIAGQAAIRDGQVHFGRCHFVSLRPDLRIGRSLIDGHAQSYRFPEGKPHDAVIFSRNNGQNMTETSSRLIHEFVSDLDVFL